MCCVPPVRCVAPLASCCTSEARNRSQPVRVPATKDDEDCVGAGRFVVTVAVVCRVAEVVDGGAVAADADVLAATVVCAVDAAPQPAETIPVMTAALIARQRALRTGHGMYKLITVNLSSVGAQMCNRLNPG